MSTHNPHDALVRRVFSRTENAVGELRAVLPEGLSARIDWASLRLVDGRFVDPELADRSTDLLFTADIAGREAFVYLLLEHQSTVDALMPLRVLRYLVRIWDRWLADHSEARRLPVIVPVVLLKHARGPGDLLAKMVSWVDLLRQVLAAPDGIEALGLVMRYAMLVDDRVTVQGIEARLVPAVGEVLREVVMTEGQRLIEKGRVEGRVEGSAEGRAQALLTFLAARGVPVSEPIRERILSCRDIITLDGWIARAATATAAADVVSEA